MRIPRSLAALAILPALGGCLDFLAPDETLEQVLDGTARAFVRGDVDYLVEHHADDFWLISENRTWGRAEYRQYAERYVRSDHYKPYAGRDVEEVFWTNQTRTWTMEELRADPEWARFVDHYGWRPEDRAASIPPNPDGPLNDPWASFYRPRDGTWVRIAGG